MFAQLGKIKFTPILSFSSFGHEKSIVLPEHALIGGKPKLQRTGTNLDTISIAVHFHVSFCNPTEQIMALNNAMLAGDILPLIWGSGAVEGDFVIKSTSKELVTSDEKGNVLEANLSVSLVENTEATRMQSTFTMAQTTAFAVSGNSPQPLQPSLTKVSETSRLMDKQKATSLNAAQIARSVAEVVKDPSKFQTESLKMLRSVALANENITSMAEALQSDKLLGIGGVMNAHLPTLNDSFNAVGLAINAKDQGGTVAANEALQTELGVMKLNAIPIVNLNAIRQ